MDLSSIKQLDKVDKSTTASTLILVAGSSTTKVHVYKIIIYVPGHATEAHTLRFLNGSTEALPRYNAGTNESLSFEINTHIVCGIGNNFIANFTTGTPLVTAQFTVYYRIEHTQYPKIITPELSTVPVPPGVDIPAALNNFYSAYTTGANLISAGGIITQMATLPNLHDTAEDRALYENKIKRLFAQVSTSYWDNANYIGELLSFLRRRKGVVERVNLMVEANNSDEGSPIINNIATLRSYYDAAKAYAPEVKFGIGCAYHQAVNVDLNVAEILANAEYFDELDLTDYPAITGDVVGDINVARYTEFAGYTKPIIISEFGINTTADQAVGLQNLYTAMLSYNCPLIVWWSLFDLAWWTQAPFRDLGLLDINGDENPGYAKFKELQ